MITLTEPWVYYDTTFPAGTVFIPRETGVDLIGRKKKGTIYAYSCPGASGEIFVRPGNTPTRATNEEV